MLDQPATGPEGLMTLLALRGVGNVTAEKLMAAFPTLRAMHEAAPEAFKGVANANIVSLIHDLSAMKAANDAARRELDRVEQFGCQIITCHDPAYPSRLKTIHDRPLILYYEGDLSTYVRSVACVGTRDPSDFGRIATDRISERLVQAGWTIVSGLARGVDSISHEAAVRNKVPTIAILGCGMDMINPGSRDLAVRILDGGGCVMTEQPFGREAEPGFLIRRNRLQCGMSVATFVMQTDIEGGTMHTVRYAIRQGRQLFAPVPTGRHAEDEKSRGILALTQMTGREFAQAIGANKDLLQAIHERFLDHPVAEELTGRDSYDRMLQVLDSLLESQPEPEPQGSLFVS